MSLFPFSGTRLPYADPPYPMTVGGSDGRIETDNCGVKFDVIGDKYIAAAAMLEHGLKNGGRVISPKDFNHREGAINIVYRDFKPVDVEPHYKDVIPNFDMTPEKRPEVLEIIDLMKRALKMKVFL